MSIQIRYLNWDGFYTPSGVCNRRRDPADVGQRAQLHLSRLGFYSGPIDSKTSDVFKDAVRHFKYFPNKPIASKGTTSLQYSTGPEKNKEQPIVCLAPADDIDRQRIENAGHLGADIMKSLDEMFPWPQPIVRPKRGARGSAEPVVARTSFKSPQTGGTLDRDELAVRIVEVPSEFNLHDEFAVVKIKLSAFERIESMLIRVYRNFNPDEPPIAPKDQQVYQEVLLSEDILALPAALPEDGFRGRHKADAPDIMRAKRWAPGPFFKMKEHAPYKFRIWVSTSAEAFDEYIDETGIERFPQYDERLWEMRRSQRDAALERKNPGSSFDEPKENATLVHDQSKLAGPEDDPVWTELDFEGVNLTETPCPEHNDDDRWKAASRYFKLPAPWGAPGIAEKLLDNPVATYLRLWNLRKDDINFKAKYLEETIEEILRFIMRTRQSLCCGRDRLTTQDAKDQILETFKSAEAELVDLKFKGYPYKDTVKFCAAVAAVTDWIVHHTRTIPELQHYQLAERDAFGRFESFGRERGGKSSGYSRTELALTLGHERNLAASKIPSEPSNYVTVMEKLTENKCAEVFEGFIDTPPRAGRNNNQVKRAIENADIILIPSYRPLDEEFFTRTRQVPVFMVGLIDLHYLNADAHRYTPWRFFKHDLFHTVSAAEPPPVKEQLWHWMKQHLVEASVSDPRRYIHLRKLRLTTTGWKENNNAVEVPEELKVHGFRTEMRELICRTWHTNAEILHAGRNKLQWMGQRAEDPHTAFQKAYDIVLFCLLHEPISTDSPRSYSPAVPDPEDLTRRLEDSKILDGIRKRAEHYWFGPPSEITGSVVANLGLAREVICALIREQKLTSTRSVIHDVEFPSLSPPELLGRREVKANGYYL